MCVNIYANFIEQHKLKLINLILLIYYLREIKILIDCLPVLALIWFGVVVGVGEAAAVAAAVAVAVAVGRRWWGVLSMGSSFSSCCIIWESTVLLMLGSWFSLVGLGLLELELMLKGQRNVLFLSR